MAIFLKRGHKHASIFAYFWTHVFIRHPSVHAHWHAGAHVFPSSWSSLWPAVGHLVMKLLATLCICSSSVAATSHEAQTPPRLPPHSCYIFLLSERGECSFSLFLLFFSCPFNGLWGFLTLLLHSCVAPSHLLPLYLHLLASSLLLPRHFLLFSHLLS